MKIRNSLAILCSAAFCFALSLAGCNNKSSGSNNQSGGGEAENQTWTVTFNSQGGSPVAAQQVKNGEKATKPTDPTREGYAFKNWYEEAAGITPFDFNAEITTNWTLYAGWQQSGGGGGGGGGEVDPPTPPQPTTYDYYVTIGSVQTGLVKQDKPTDAPENMQDKYKGEVASVTAGQTIAFSNGTDVIRPGSDTEDENNKNNKDGDWENGFTIHNDATNVEVYLTVWNNGYSFWITGYQDGGVTPPQPSQAVYSANIGGNSFNFASVDMDAGHPANQVAQYQAQAGSVEQGQTITFYKDADVIRPGSDAEDALNKNNISGDWENGFTIHNNASDVVITLKEWNDGYSFWITGYEAGETPTPTNSYSMTIGSVEVTFAQADKESSDPENLVAKYHGTAASVTAGATITFYKDADVIRPGSDAEDAQNKNNISGDWENGYTIHNDAENVDVWLKEWNDGYSFWITGYEAGETPTPSTNGHGPEGSHTVSWYIVGKGSFTDYDWDLDHSIQMYSNPSMETDLGCILNVRFESGDIFKVSNGTVWYGYEKVDQYDDGSGNNKGITNFEAVDDGYPNNDSDNIKCTVTGNYDIYVNQSGQFWIQAAAE